MTTYSNYQQIIEGIYKKHNPDKLADIPKLLDKYQGHEHKLVESLFAKYDIGKNEQQEYFAVNTYVMPERETNASNVTAGIIVIAIVITCITGYVIYGNQPTQDEGNSQANLAFKNDNAPAVVKRETSINETYTVTSETAHFSLNPEPNQRLSEHLYRGDKFTATKECNGYVYGEYTDKLGSVSKGWIEHENIAREMSEKEAKDIVTTLKVQVEEELKQSVKLRVIKLLQSNGWASVRVELIPANDSLIDYTGTVYQKMIDEGAFDELVLGLLQLRNGRWKVVEYEIGGTDDPSPWVEKHQLQDIGKALELTP